MPLINLISRTKKDPTKLKPSMVNLNFILYLIVGAAGVLGVYFIINAILVQELKFFILAGSCLITFVLGVLTISNLWPASLPIKIVLFIIVFEITLSVIAGVYPSLSGTPYAILAVGFGFLLASLISKSTASDWVITIGLIGAILAIQLTILAPLPQDKIPLLTVILSSLSLLLILFVAFLFLRQNIVATLRTKLIFGSLGLTLVPLAILSLINSQYLQTAIQNQSQQSLSVAANQTANVVDSYIAKTMASVVSESQLSSIVNYIRLDPNLREGSPQETELRTTFQSLQTKEKIYRPSYGLINLVGENIYDTTSENIGQSERFTSYFQNSVISNTSYVSTVEFPKDTHQAYIYFINPVKDENGQVIGFLRARFDARIIQLLINQSIGLIGTRSYPILLDSNGLRIADGFSPNLLYKTIWPLTTDQFNSLLNHNQIPSYLTEAAVTSENKDIANVIQKPSSTGYFTTSLNTQQSQIPLTGTVKALSTEHWYLVFLQDQASLTEALTAQNRISTTLATVIAGIVAALITFVAALFSNPIIRLTEAAEKISAGDLSVQAKVTSNDEIGVLGQSFNSMTRQLKEFIDTLENRVRERTVQLAEQNESLQFRTRQLQTLADVARIIVSTRDFDTLLTTVTNLVSERFGFYHAGIFLLDENNEFAVLRAANSIGGRKMLDRQHRLRIGQVGMVGYVTGTGNPRIATDVGEDAVFFNNPDLPDTKSEMTLPLKVEDRVIGALDVQSTQSNAFSQEDISLFTTLADQVALAINNNQLFSDTEKALEESQNLYRQYLQQEWTHQTEEVGSTNYKYTADGLIPFEEDLPEIRMVLDSARPVFKTQQSQGDGKEIRSVMAVPILLRGQSIGVIHLEESADKDYVWSQNELLTVQAVADQVAQTLENARLFETTLRRADRERKVLEITSKIRSTNDPQQMLQITLEELKKNLGATQAQIVINIPETSATPEPSPDITKRLDGSNQNLMPEGAL